MDAIDEIDGPAKDKEGLEGAREQLEKANLVFPPVPVALRGEFKRFGKWSWGSKELDAMLMYMFPLRNPFLSEDKQVVVPSDYVALSAAGHGINSYALNYHLVQGPLAVVFQIGWDGVYMDRVKQENLWAETCEMTAALATLASKISRAGGTSEEVGLVQYSEFRGISNFQVLKRGSVSGFHAPKEGIGVRVASKEEAFEQAHAWLIEQTVSAV